MPLRVVGNRRDQIGKDDGKGVHINVTLKLHKRNIYFFTNSQTAAYVIILLPFWYYPKLISGKSQPK